MSAENDQAVERAAIKNRIARYKAMLAQVDDGRAREAIRDILADLEQQLASMDKLSE